MAGPNLFQVKRTSVTGREANTTTLVNPGEIGVNLTDGRMWVANTTDVFEIGANCNVSHITTSLHVGSATVNVLANSTHLRLANSTVTFDVVKPTAAQVTSADYYLASDSAWKQVTGGAVATRVYESWLANSTVNTTFTVTGGYTVGQVDVYYNGVHLAEDEYTATTGTTVVLGVPALVGSIIEVVGWDDFTGVFATAAGSDTQVQFNDATVLAGSGGFTFNKTANTVTIANTLFAGAGQSGPIAVPVPGLNLGSYYDGVGISISHIDVYGGSYGFGISPGSFNYIASSAQHAFYNDPANPATFTILSSGAVTALLSSAVGANVVLSTADIKIGNSTVNAFANSLLLQVSDATGLGKLTPAALTLNAVSATTNGFAASPALLQIGNTSISANHTPTGFVVGSRTITSTGIDAGLLTAGNTTVTGFVNATVSVNSALHSVGATFTANATLVNAAAINITGAVNTATLFTSGAAAVSTTLSSGNVTTTGFVNATVSVNSALHTVGTAFIANTIGVYHTGTMNAASHTVGSGTVVNSTVIVSAGSLLSANIQVNPQTTTYTLAASDSGKIIPVTNTTATTLTILAGLPIGFRVQATRMGAGTLTVSNTGQTGVTMFSRTGLFAVTAQYGSVSIYQPSANVYIVDGLV